MDYDRAIFWFCFIFMIAMIIVANVTISNLVDNISILVTQWKSIGL
jgi:hypothetical protein